MDKKKVFISGGAGFLGSFLCGHYLKNNCEVWCMDNFITSSRDNIEEYLNDRNFTFIEKDVIDFTPENMPTDFNYVYHLASPASPPDYFKFPFETLRVNSIGTENCLKLALSSGAAFLYSSTSEVYGDPLIPVQNEEYWGNVNSIGVRSVYDEGKRYGEAITMAYNRKYNLNTHIVRIFNTYGPRMRLNDGRVIPNFIHQSLSNQSFTIYGDGKQTRSFCYVDDLIKGITLLIEKDYHLPVNLGNPGEFTVIELAELIQKLQNKKSNMVFMAPLEDDPKRRRPDISKAKELLGWQPKVALEEGLRKTLDYFQEKILNTKQEEK
ncbi:SDR family oxidoreductase [bacterium]|nr:SDR family oxidoreductase [bacterium]